MTDLHDAEGLIGHRIWCHAYSSTGESCTCDYAKRLERKAMRDQVERMRAMADEQEWAATKVSPIAAAFGLANSKELRANADRLEARLMEMEDEHV